MGLLQKLGGGQGYLKAGFMGAAGSGKTFTSSVLAVGTRAHFKLLGPIGIFDTESGSEYVAKKIQKATGVEPVGLRSRSLSDLLEVAKECEQSGVSVLIVDSMTHIWRECCDSYLQAVNKVRSNNNMTALQKLEFQHWSAIKDKFGKWTEFFLNSKMHIIVCGRLGYDYEFEENESGKKELIKTGVKMKTEGEFGYEPSLLVVMEIMQQREGGKLTANISRRATILKDRFDVIDGKQFENPNFDTFKPHIDLLTPGAHAPIDTAAKTEHNVNTEGASAWDRERRQRTIVSEEIQAALVRAWPGQSAAEKKAKAELLEKHFGTGSWTKIESDTPSAKLLDGLKTLREELDKLPKEAA